MAKTVLELCEEYTAHLSYDLDLAKKIEEFKLKWSYKNDDHLEFLASNLTGVHVIRFSARDEEMLYRDVFGVDKDDFEYELWRTPGINKNFKVSSNPTFMLLMFIAHKYLNTRLPKQQIELVVTNLYFIFAFKVLGSIYSQYFKYPTSLAVAKMVYEKQNDKYLLKQCGSWQGVLEYRAEDLLLPSNVNHKRLKTFKTDDVVKMLNDLQGRLRDIIKNVFVLIKEASDENKIISDTSLIEEDDEAGERIRETDNKTASYIRYINDIINSPGDFIQEDLLTFIRDRKLFPNTDKDNLREILKYISNTGDITLTKEQVNIPEYLITNAMLYLTRKGFTDNLSQKLYSALIAIKAYWSSSSVNDPILKKIKAHLSTLVTKAVSRRTNYIVATYVLATMLYIFIRAYRRSNK